jgi:hypothetical protein
VYFLSKGNTIIYTWGTGHMSRWKPLPADLEPLNRELIIRLRELKDQTGMSAAEMARKTT